ncbi:ATP-dependent RNA helicase p62-like [Elysia marginata]|uniref:ATP-dependent RNA helicase p62-like n=1 Tax=Elysia marginata TaxID=1093978 RepID=A0AAV4FJ60_9GAST|nr:ATP-dependent RNA helicase p62-like [Elysia marginata]
MGTQVVPEPVLKSNCVLLVAYIDKLLKTGPDGLVLHGLMQLQDYLRVGFLAQAFREHHCQRVVEILAAVPYKAPVRYMASQVLQMLTGERSRRASVKEMDADPTWHYLDPDSDDELGTTLPAEQAEEVLACQAQHQMKGHDESKKANKPVSFVVGADSSSEEMGKDSTYCVISEASPNKDLMAVAERIVTSALADATRQEPEAEVGAAFGSDDKNLDCQQGDETGDVLANNRSVHLQSDETEEDDDNDSEIDANAEVQVNIIGATDEDDSYEDNEDNSNNINRNEEFDDDDEDFEIISVNDQDYNKGIAPPDIRRQTHGSTEKHKQETDLRHPLFDYSYPRARLKSRKSFRTVESVQPDQAASYRLELWNTWDNTTNEAIQPPKEQLPSGRELQRKDWVTLNRTRAIVGKIASTLHKWKLRPNSECPCGNQNQTMDHIQSECTEGPHYTDQDLRDCTDAAQA